MTTITTAETRDGVHRAYGNHISGLNDAHQHTGKTWWDCEFIAAALDAHEAAIREEAARGRRDAENALYETTQWHHHLKHLYTDGSTRNFMECYVQPCAKNKKLLAAFDAARTTAEEPVKQ